MTLTDAASFTKKAFVIIIVLFIIFTIAVISVQAYLKAQKEAVIPPEEKPDLKYGLLDKPNLEETLTDSSIYNFTLNTSDGKLPSNFPKMIKVYFIPKLGTTLLASEKAKELAKSFNFTKGPNILSPTKYQFTNDSNGQITIDLDSSNFSFNREASAEAEMDQTLPDKSALADELKQYLKSKDLYPEELQGGKSEVIYNQDNIDTSTSAKIYLWQQDIDELPVITSLYTKGLISATLTKAKEEDQRYLSLHYTIWNIDKTNFATYPLKDINQAFEDLKKGQSSVVIEPNNPQVSIIDIKLAYLLSENYSKYLQPVYLFLGENDAFAAIVSAIPKENLAN